MCHLGVPPNNVVRLDARVASVRITAGDVAPGADDERPHDIVMTDDFIYGEPQRVQ